MFAGDMIGSGMSENQGKEMAAVELMKVILEITKGYSEGGFKDERKAECFSLYKECLAVVSGTESKQGHE